MRAFFYAVALAMVLGAYAIAHASGGFNSGSSATALSAALTAVHSVTTSGTATIDSSAETWPCDTTSGSFQINLPNATTVWNGAQRTVKKTVASNTLTIGSVSGTIDGSSTRTVTTANESVSFVSDGTNWLVK